MPSYTDAIKQFMDLVDANDRFLISGNTGPSTLSALGYQQITSLSSAATLTVPTGARLALIQPETQAVRWRDDGTAPTSSEGMPLAAGETLPYTGNLSAIKFIESAAGAKLNVSYYG